MFILSEKYPRDFDETAVCQETFYPLLVDPVLTAFVQGHCSCSLQHDLVTEASHNIIVKKNSPVDNKRGIDVDLTNGSSSDSDEDDNEDPRGKNFSSAFNSNHQYSFSTGLPSYSSRAKSFQPASLRRTEESKVREAAVLLKSPAAANSRFYTSKAGEYGLVNGSSSYDDDDDNGEDRRGIHTTFASQHHSSNPQHSLHNSPRYKSLSTAVNTNFTPQTSAGTGHVSLRHDNRLHEVATKLNAMDMGIMLPTSPIVCSSKGDYRFGDSLTERGPILLDAPNGRNELVMAAHSTQSIPKLYPIVGLRGELPGIALPSAIPLDLIHQPQSSITQNMAVQHTSALLTERPQPTRDKIKNKG